MNFGTKLTKGKAEFAVHSTSENLWLMLFDDPNDDKPSHEIKMERSGSSFSASAYGIKEGTCYLYRTEDNQWLLDPYAKAVHTPNQWGDKTGYEKGTTPKNGKMFPKSVIVSGKFNWRWDHHPKRSIENSIIYEAHLRGFTCNSGGGTYLDFIDKIDYLKKLGITAVEFLPLFEFNELEYFFENNSRSDLLNFWGYNTRSFFAPMSRYARSKESGAAVKEFKTLVRALHKAGIEVILDVVFNHTAEGGDGGPIYSFRGLDKKSYYILDQDGKNHNWSGCGNTVNANNPKTRQFIVDCLSYWAKEMRVDGFRFDLATCLCRGEDGNLMGNPPLIKAIESAPALKNVKLIAEAWDCDAYQVGSFPGKRFSEWNGRYRDDIRRFWNKDEKIGALATRLSGSSDLYEQQKGGAPRKSINFITAHDGFTIADLISYEGKHNEANGEENHDGENNNESTNFGAEGFSDDSNICARRLLQHKNLMATLLLSQGVPMIVAGDEFGRTQQGNNNAYCQDNELSWIDWSLLEANKELFEFTKKMISIRSRFPQLRRKRFFTGEGDVHWLGINGNKPDWDNGKALGMHLPGRNRLLILINNGDEEAEFKLPRGKWKLEIFTSQDAPQKNKIPAHSLAILSR